MIGDPPSAGADHDRWTVLFPAVAAVSVGAAGAVGACGVAVASLETAPSPMTEESSDPTDPQILSTADQSTGTTSRSSARPRSSPTPAPETEQEQLRRTISDLSGQVNKLSDKLGQMEEHQRSLVDLERLSRAEQRAGIGIGFAGAGNFGMEE